MPTDSDAAPTPSDELAKQSDDELFDILTHIDRHQFPERYSVVRDEFARRQGTTINGQPLDDYFDGIRRKRPLATRSTLRKKMLIGLAVWSLAMLALRAVMYLRNAH
jgi:hypothetical protein